MPTLGQLRAAIETDLAARYADIKAAQDAYFAAHGRYFQGVLTHTSIPAHTVAVQNDAAPDNMAGHPTDQAETWNDFLPGIAGQSMPAALETHVYDGPDGPGWTLRQRCSLESEEFQREREATGKAWRRERWGSHTPESE